MWHLGPLHPAEQALVLVLAFGPFVLLGGHGLAEQEAQLRRQGGGDPLMSARMSPTVRTDPPLNGAETDILRGFLDYHRDTLRLKAEGLDAEQLGQRLPPSTLTLGGPAQAHGLRRGLVVQPGVRGQSGTGAVGLRRLEGRRATGSSTAPRRTRRTSSASSTTRWWPVSDRILVEALARPEQGLETPSPSGSATARPVTRFSLRWILVHLIEEYARHNGHADLIRESVDGQVGGSSSAVQELTGRRS